MLHAGSEEELAEHPEAFVRTATAASSANGRDPYFPPWPDVVQLNAYSPALREAVAETLIGGRRRSATACAATWRC